MGDVTLEYRGLTIAVRSADDELVERVFAYLCPPFLQVAARGARFVDVLVDSAAYHSLLDAARPTSTHLECFTLDQGHVSLPELHLWQHLEDQERRVAVDAGHEVLLEPLAPHGARILTARNSDGSRLFLLRTIRELATAHALEQGDVHLHASAIATPAGATLFTGRKNAGKSSMLLYQLEQLQGGASFLANDRVLVDDAGLARGMPSIVSFRAPTLARHPRVPARRLPPSEVAALFGTHVTPAGAPARALVFLAIDPSVDTFDLAPLPSDETLRRLASEALLAGGTQAALFARPSPSPSRPLADRLAALAARVPGFALRLGPRAYDTPDLAERLTRLTRLTR